MSKTLAVVGVLFVACGSSSSSVDAPVSGVDAPGTTADAKPGTPDAKPGTPDAKPGTADAPISAIDAPPSAMCFPQCFLDVLSGLTAPCTPSGACTTNFNINTFTTTTCFANGVKYVSAIDLGTQAVTMTVKKSGGDTCYTQTTMATGQTSASIVWKNAGGSTVLEVDVPNTSMANIENVICGGGSPTPVDLNSSVCMAERPDAGPGPDGGLSCTMDAACVP